MSRVLKDNDFVYVEGARQAQATPLKLGLCDGLTSAVDLIFKAIDLPNSASRVSNPTAKKAWRTA